MNLQDDFTISTAEIRAKTGIVPQELHRYCNEYRYKNNGYYYHNKPIFKCGIDYVFIGGRRFFHKSYENVDWHKIIKERLLELRTQFNTYKNLGKVEK